jgi:hypothetical protein
MSGPIVRRYGFPNFEKIFGERDVQHGVEGEDPASASAHAAGDASKPKSADDASASKPHSDAERRSGTVR